MNQQEKQQIKLGMNQQKEQQDNQQESQQMNQLSDNKISYKEFTNPVIMSDYPDPDVIRVDETYYMVSTTMHMMPGCVILRSYNLCDWEIAAYVFDKLDSTPGQKLENNGIYGKGMWAASLRHHNGKFYLCFVANDTGKTYVYESTQIEGPWKKHELQGFYHDCSILFDDDGKIYIVYGNRQIHVSELESDLTKTKNGTDKIILEDGDEYKLGFEGAHFYKINGKYYLFFIHWSKYGTKRRTEACYVSDHVFGPYEGRDVLDDDMGFRNAGVAQGGIVDTPDNEWYAILFQDYGALGRLPVLVPVYWKNNFPVFGVDGKVPEKLQIRDKRPQYQYEPLNGNDDFIYNPDENGQIQFKKFWQWNHEPDDRGWSLTERPDFLRLKTLDLRVNVVNAVNTLTQRTYGNACHAETVLDGSAMKYGDYAGISAFMSKYCFIALTKNENGFELVQLKRSQCNEKDLFIGGIDDKPGLVCARVKVSDPVVKLKVSCRFGTEKDIAECFYEKDGKWMKLGETYPLQYTLDHFMGCRFALSYFSTINAGGIVDFDSFSISSDT